jgi:hypothetical protein
METFRAVINFTFVKCFTDFRSNPHTYIVKCRRFLRCKAVQKKKSADYGNWFYKIGKADFKHKIEDFEHFL